MNKLQASQIIQGNLCVNIQRYSKDVSNILDMKILLGIQPTGRIHIGNYFGAIKKGIDMQNEGHDVHFLVAQYHANASDEATKDMINSLERLGAKSVCEQGSNTLELFYKLSHSTSVTELARLPQYQTKEQTLHMLSYPLLMACDIIMSDCDAVIVGEDQEPHMHFYREIARRNGCNVAKTIKSDTPKIMSIKDPSVKMSKSLGDKHCIYLDDTREEIYKKIKASPTNEGGLESLKYLANLFGSGFDTTRCGESKEDLANTIYTYFNI